MTTEELADLGAERETADAHVVGVDPLGSQQVGGLMHGGIAAADGDQRHLGARLMRDLRSRHMLSGMLELPLEAVDEFLIRVGVLGVESVLVMAGATHEVRALATHTGKRARRDAVAVHVEVARELLDLLKCSRVEHLAAIGLVGVVPLEALHHPVIHPDVEVARDEDGCLVPIGEVERLDGHLKALLGIRREEQEMLGVAVRGVGEREQIGLLRARRHAGRWAAALHVDEDRGDVGVVREPDELLHERDAGARRVRERSRARPPGTDHDARG